MPGEEVLRKFIGPPIVYSLKTYTGMSDEDAEKAVWLFREDYEAGGCYLSKVYDGCPNCSAVCGSGESKRASRPSSPKRPPGTCWNTSGSTT